MRGKENLRTGPVLIGIVLAASLLLPFTPAEGQSDARSGTRKKRTPAAQESNPEIAELRRRLVEIEQEKNLQIEELKVRLAAIEEKLAGQGTAPEGAKVAAPVRDEPSSPEPESARAATPIEEPRRAGPDGLLERTRLEVDKMRKQLPFTLGASAWLYYFQPLKSEDFGGDNALELYSFYLNLSKEWDNGYGVASTLRFRDTKLRSFHDSNIYALQAYAFKRTSLGQLKVGKFYKQVGSFWDDSFFGNVHYFDGLKLDPDFGVGLEGERRLGQQWRLPYFVQFFLTDDGYHGGFTQRDAESSPATREKNTGVIRVVPTFDFGVGRSLAIGASFLRGRIDRRAGTARDNDLMQLAADVALTWGPLLAYGEFLHQDGRNSLTFPRIGGSSTSRYWLAGVQYDWGSFNWRVNFSLADYEEGVEEYIVQPGVVYTITEGIKLWLEYDFWRRRDGEDGRTIDQSFNAALHVQF